MNVSVAGAVIALCLVIVVWIAFVVPAERRYHERKLKIIEERIERRRERLQQERAGQAPADAPRDPGSDSL